MTWITLALIVLAIVVDNVQDAIDRQGARVAAACQKGQAPHAEGRRP